MSKKPKHIGENGQTEFWKSADDQYWKENLTPEQYYVTRQSGTERPFTGQYDKHFEDGEYYCVNCGDELFQSKDKFDSGCGWPAFSHASSGEKIKETEDNSHGMTRVEVRCKRCDAHLGHVFPDGPKDRGGMRYCINSAALFFNDRKSD